MGSFWSSCILSHSEKEISHGRRNRALLYFILHNSSFILAEQRACRWLHRLVRSLTPFSLIWNRSALIIDRVGVIRLAGKANGKIVVDDGAQYLHGIRMRVGLRCFPILPDFSLVLRQFAEDGHQRFECGRTPISANLPAGCDGDLENFLRVGHKLKCEAEDDHR